MVQRHNYHDGTAQKVDRSYPGFCDGLSWIHFRRYNLFETGLTRYLLCLHKLNNLYQLHPISKRIEKSKAIPAGNHGFFHYFKVVFFKLSTSSSNICNLKCDVSVGAWQSMFCTDMQLDITDIKPIPFT